MRKRNAMRDNPVEVVEIILYASSVCMCVFGNCNACVKTPLEMIVFGGFSKLRILKRGKYVVISAPTDRHTHAHGRRFYII